MTGYETILAEVESRLTTPSDFVPGTYGTRRGHLTPVPVEEAPGSHIVGGDDNRIKGSQCGREADFTVAIFTRSNEGSKAADPYLEELYVRLAAKGWPKGVSVTPGDITRETEIADKDAARTDCKFRVCYSTPGPWSLDLAEG